MLVLPMLPFQSQYSIHLYELSAYSFLSWSSIAEGGRYTSLLEHLVLALPMSCMACPVLGGHTTPVSSSEIFSKYPTGQGV
jgi:hypothetical protein